MKSTKTYVDNLSDEGFPLPEIQSQTSPTLESLNRSKKYIARPVE